MKGRITAVIMLFTILALAGCGGGGGNSSPPAITTQILSNPAIDGDITPANAFPIVQGMTPTVQSVIAGIDPVSLMESRAFLDFPLTGSGGVPGNAVIASATLDIFINNILPLAGTIPIRIDLVDIQPPTLLVSDFDTTILLAKASISTAIFQSDFNRHVVIDVTALMKEAQRLGLLSFQIRILENFGIVTPGLIEINDATGADRATLAPLLNVTYF